MLMVLVSNSIEFTRITSSPAKNYPLRLAMIPIEGA